MRGSTETAHRKTTALLAPAPQPAPAAAHPVQAPPSHYGAAYLNLPRINCCWRQAAEVAACGGRQVLEVGPGSGLTSWLLAKWGLQVWTVDLEGGKSKTLTYRYNVLVNR